MQNLFFILLGKLSIKLLFVTKKIKSNLAINLTKFKTLSYAFTNTIVPETNALIKLIKNILCFAQCNLLYSFNFPRRHFL